MSEFSYEYLIGVDPPDNAGFAGEISEGDAYVPIHVTPCRYDAGTDGKWIFEEDVRLFLYFKPIDLATPDEPEAESWWAFIVTSPDDGLTGQDLVLATFPYSHDYVDHARFKRPLKRGPADEEKLLRDARRAPGGPLRFLNERSYNLRTGGWTAAVLQDPKRTSQATTTGKTIFGKPSFEVASAPKETPMPRFRWGLVRGRDGGAGDPLAEATADLMSSTHLTKLVDHARDGSLYFVYWGGEEPLDHAPLSDVVKEKAEEIMESAIRKALAGPNQGIEWEGQPVARLADFIFRDTLNNMNRRKGGKRRDEATKERALTVRARDEFARLVDKARAGFGASEASPDARAEATLAALESGTTDSSILGCAAAAAATVDEGPLQRDVIAALRSLVSSKEKAVADAAAWALEMIQPGAQETAP